MTLDEFWDHIKKSRRKDADAHAERLEARLAKLPPDEILDFGHWWDLMTSEAYHWMLWGAAYIINGGCSDDGFEYFRGWLVLQGRDVFQSAVSDPDTLAGVVKPAEDGYECECYVASGAWFAATGTAPDDAGYAALRAAEEARHPGPLKEYDMGEQWDFDDDTEVRKRLPRLAALYLDRGANE